MSLATTGCARRRALLAADAFGEPAVWAVHVQQDRPARVAEAVRGARLGREERPRLRLHDLVAADELRGAFEDEERVDLVVVGMRGDAGPLRLDVEQQHRDLRKVTEDRDRAVLALEALGAALPRDDRVGRGA